MRGIGGEAGDVLPHPWMLQLQHVSLEEREREWKRMAHVSCGFGKRPANPHELAGISSTEGKGWPHKLAGFDLLFLATHAGLLVAELFVAVVAQVAVTGNGLCLYKGEAASN